MGSNFLSSSRDVLLRLFFSVKYRCVLSVLFMVTSNRTPLLCFAMGTVSCFKLSGRIGMADARYGRVFYMIGLQRASTIHVEIFKLSCERLPIQSDFCLMG